MVIFKLRFLVLASVGANSGIVRRFGTINRSFIFFSASVGANSGIVRRACPCWRFFFSCWLQSARIQES